MRSETFERATGFDASTPPHSDVVHISMSAHATDRDLVVLAT